MTPLCPTCGEELDDFSPCACTVQPRTQRAPLGKNGQAIPQGGMRAMSHKRFGIAGGKRKGEGHEPRS